MFLMSRCVAINKTNSLRCEKNSVLDGLCMTHYNSVGVRRVEL